MSGVKYGLEIFVNCDQRRCNAQAMVWQGDPANNPLETIETEGKLPPGWTWRDGRTYCPRHSK